MNVEDPWLETAINKLDPVRPHLPVNERHGIVEPRPDAPDAMGRQKRLAVDVRYEPFGSAIRNPDIFGCGGGSYDPSRPWTSA